MITIYSPLTAKSNCKHIESIDKNVINDLYISSYDIDVSCYFEHVSSVEKYLCLDTQLEFFKPDNLAGNSELYEKLQKFDWFYKESKWEYENAVRFINPNFRVLDVGCGHGHFLRLCSNIEANAVGLEFNEQAYLYTKSEKLEVYQQSIEDHSINLSQLYDVVCAFQVLEHVVDISGFISACLASLKPGGFFIVGVPNNDAFLKFDKTNCLNLPPHHMSLWGRKSLTSLPRYFDCELHSIEVEPLNEVDWFQAVMEKRYITNRFVKSLFYRIGGSKLFKRFITDNSDSIAGHTILAVFQKSYTSG